jgi:hypothetical protein
LLAVATEGAALGATVLNRVAITLVEVLLLLAGALFLRGSRAKEERLRPLPSDRLT